MAWSYVNRRGGSSASAISSATSFAITPSAGLSQGNLAVLLVGCATASRLPTSITDNAGNTWAIDQTAGSGAAVGCVIARAVLSAGVPTTITVTIPTAGVTTTYAFSLDEFSNPTIGARVSDVGQVNTGTSSTLSSGTTPAPSAQELAVAGFAWAGSTATSSGFTTGYQVLAAVIATGSVSTRLCYQLSVGGQVLVTASLTASPNWAGAAQLYTAANTTSTNWSYVRRNTPSQGGVGYTSIGSGLTSMSLTLNTGAAIGDLVVVVIATSTANRLPTAATDGLGNTWVKDSDSGSVTAPGLSIFRCTVTHTIADNGTITVTIPNVAATTHYAFVIDEFAATTGAQVADVHSAGNHATSTAPTTGSSGTPSAGDLSIAAYAWASSSVAISAIGGGSYNALDAASNVNSGAALSVAIAYNLGVPAAAQNVGATLGSSVAWAGLVQTYTDDHVAVTTSQTFSLTQSQSVTVVRQVQRSFTMTQAMSTVLQRVALRTMTQTQAQSTSLQRTASRAVTTTQSQSATLQRTVGRVPNVTQSQSVATPQRTANRALAVTQSQSPALQRIVSRALAATQAQTVTLGATLTHAVAATQAQSVTFQRAAARIASAGQAQSTTLQAAIGRNVTTSQSQTTGIQGKQAASLATSQSQSVALHAVAGRVVSAAQSQSAALLWVITRSVSVAQSQTVALRKLVAAVIPTDQAQAVSYQAQHTPKLVLTATQNQTATLAIAITTTRTVSQRQAALLLIGGKVLFPGHLFGSQTTGGVLVPSEIDGDPVKAAVSAGQSMLSGVLSGRIKGGVR